MILRHYQKEIKFKFYDAIRQGARCVVMRAGTGTGKTVVFSDITRQLVNAGKRVLILTHRLELWKQASLKATENNIDHGIIAPNIPERKCNVQIGSIQSLISRLKNPKTINFNHFDPDLIVIDEGHHVVEGNQWGFVLDAYPRAKVLLPTATPCRLDGKGLGVGFGGYGDVLIETKSEAWMIENNFLCDYKIKIPSLFDVSGVPIGANGEYNQKKLQEAIKNQRFIVGDMIDEYENGHVGEAAIVFAPSVSEAEVWASNFRARGFKFYSVDGNMEINKRSKLIEQLTKGEIHGLVNCDIFSEGTDIPRIQVIFDGYTTASLVKKRQRDGRGLRLWQCPKTGKVKEHVYIYDHCGNAAVTMKNGHLVMKHGFPDTEYEWSLESVPKRKKKEGVKKEGDFNLRHCPQCYEVHKSSNKCPNCGYIYTQNEINVMEGRMEELEKERIILISKQNKVEQAQTKGVEDLILLQIKRGKNPWTAFYIHNSRIEKSNKKVSEKINALLVKFQHSIEHLSDLETKKRFVDEEKAKLQKWYKMEAVLTKEQFTKKINEVKKWHH